MRSLIALSVLVVLAAARPESVPREQQDLPDIDGDSVQSVLRFLPVITESIRGSDRSQAVQKIGSAVAEIIKENAPEERKEQIEGSADLTNAILSAVGDLVKDVPAVDVPEIVIPKVVIPKVVIPDIPEVKIPDFEIPDFSKTDFSKPQEIVIPEIKVPDVPEVNIPDIPEFNAPEIVIPEFNIRVA
ncbi:periaxin-like [Hyalella azteca]|uniref:Periaxin-like n=1 Tax=Hyalella azteca TaxID=294128 RepID=A0A8B7MZH3_HYAAZ|nr:periaxin-like [Hyalella azteca]